MYRKGKHKSAVLDVSKEAGVELSGEKTKYVFMLLSPDCRTFVA
jgi:hypothetical protein